MTGTLIELGALAKVVTVRVARAGFPVVGLTVVGLKLHANTPNGALEPQLSATVPVNPFMDTTLTWIELVVCPATTVELVGTTVTEKSVTVTGAATEVELAFDESPP